MSCVNYEISYPVWKNAVSFYFFQKTFGVHMDGIKERWSMLTSLCLQMLQSTKQYHFDTYLSFIAYMYIDIGTLKVI